VLQYLVNGLAAGCGIALVGASFTLIYAATRFFHFAHGAVYLVAAYATYAAIVLAHCPPVLGWSAGLAVAVVLGALMEMLIFRPLRRRGAKSLALLLASLGLSIAIQNVVSLVFGEGTLLLRQGPAVPVFDFFGSRISFVQAVMIGTAAAATMLLAAALRFTRYGKMFRAFVNDPDLALTVGIPVERMTVLAFCVGSAMTALVAIISGYDTDLQPAMGFRALLLGVVAAIVGGRGNIVGALLGGLLVGTTQHVGIWRISTVWQEALVYLVLVVFLVFRPQGFFGKPLDRDTA
jgi:branched-chain amino acid transport system permease protein